MMMTSTGALHFMDFVRHTPSVPCPDLDLSVVADGPSRARPPSRGRRLTKERNVASSGLRPVSAGNLPIPICPSVAEDMPPPPLPPRPTSSHALRRTMTLSRKNATIKRWDGIRRTALPWDSLRRDAELYDVFATCAVHYHARGRSQRGPSLRVPYEAVVNSGCLPALLHSGRSSGGHSPASDSGYSSHGGPDNACKLFLPAPDSASREEALDYHIATRNIFAWIMNKPVVGASLGQALIELLDRLLLVRPAAPDTLSKFLQYMECMGYFNMTDEPNYALAMLVFAEHFRLKDLWVDAFVHCVGMNDLLYQSLELELVSKQTQAAITRAYLKMDLKITKTTKALANFFEDDISPARLGLTPTQRSHLDHFRSHINSYYVNKLGYWPPTHISKGLLHAIHDDFQSLYDYLANKDSSSSQTSITTGGLCVLQNVGAFDERHGFVPLPHPLPLAAHLGDLHGRDLAVRGLRSFLASKSARKDLIANAQRSLETATNRNIANVSTSGLLRSYREFERDSVSRLDSDLTVNEARKIRWIQIYSTLQMLTSITSSPAQFTLSPPPSYNTCCTVPDMPWPTQRLSLLSVHPALRARSHSLASPTDAPLDFCGVAPDCSRDEYFASRNHTRNDSGIVMTSPRPKTSTDTFPSFTRAASLLHSPGSFRSTSSHGGNRVRLPIIPRSHFSVSSAGSRNSMVGSDDSPAPPPPPGEMCELTGCPRTTVPDLERLLNLSTCLSALGPFELDAAPLGGFSFESPITTTEDDHHDDDHHHQHHHQHLLEPIRTDKEASYGLTKADLLTYDGPPASVANGSVRNRDSGVDYWSGSEYSRADDDYDGRGHGHGHAASDSSSSSSDANSSAHHDSVDTPRTAASTPVLPSPAGARSWAGDYRDCLKGEGYFTPVLGGRALANGEDEDEGDFWCDVPRDRR